MKYEEGLTEAYLETAELLIRLDRIQPTSKQYAKASSLKTFYLRNKYLTVKQIRLAKYLVNNV